MLYHIALGSNLGDRLGLFRQGIALLLDRDVTASVIAMGSIYETEPVDCPPDSPSFFNTVIELESELEPHALHQVLRSIERDLGRPDERGHHAPRPLDLDIIAAGSRVIDDAVLTIPHPRFHLRHFVLAPLADIAPDLVLPGQTQSVQSLLSALPGAWDAQACGGLVMPAK